MSQTYSCELIVLFITYSINLSDISGIKKIIICHSCLKVIYLKTCMLSPKYKPNLKVINIKILINTRLCSLIYNMEIYLLINLDLFIITIIIIINNGSSKIKS